LTWYEDKKRLVIMDFNCQNNQKIVIESNYSLSKEGLIMRLIEWEVSEDGYEEQIVIPKEKRDLADAEGISTKNGQKLTVRILNLNSGESYLGRLAITGNRIGVKSAVDCYFVKR